MATKNHPCLQPIHFSPCLTAGVGKVKFQVVTCSYLFKRCPVTRTPGSSHYGNNMFSLRLGPGEISADCVKCFR